MNNIPAFVVTLNGEDLTGKIRPRLVSLDISERRDDAADQLTLTLDDSDGKLAIPAPGAELAVSLGWKQGSDVTIGLVDKGLFHVDAIAHSGPPDQIRLSAKSADFTSSLRIRREQSWTETTLGTVLREVAMRNGLSPRVSADLAAIQPASLTQSRESDAAFLRRLGGEYDAVATIKARCMIFAPKGAGTTAGGDALPALQLARRDGDRHRWATEARRDYPGVTASWHDRAGAQRQTVTVGDKAGARHLRRIYASKTDAIRAAKAEYSRIQRDPASLDLSLAFGQADAAPEQRVTVSGFKAEIDAQTWLIREVTHHLGGNGFTTDIRMESAP